MRPILILAVVAVAGGVYAARFADHSLTQPMPQAAIVELASYGRTLTIEADRAGHFQIEARVESRRLEFMVDTGASLVVLRETDAATVGIRPSPSEYTTVVSTANGKIKAAPAKLGRVEVGSITVYDVPALVLPDEVLSQNLLGISFLSRLRRYEYADGRLVLEQ